MVDEFLRTRAGTAALADVYRVRRGRPAPDFDSRTLIDAVGFTAAGRVPVLVSVRQKG